MNTQHLATRRAFAASAGAVAAAYVRAPARAAQFEFRAAGGMPPEHPQTVRAKQMWAAIERESGGRVNTQFFPNAQLGSDSAIFSQLRVGAVHFFATPPSISVSIVPSGGIIDLGFAFKDVPEALRAMDGSLGEYIRKEFTAKGLHALSRIWNSGMHEMASATRPIRSAADVAGFKIRIVESKITVDLFRALGASPTPMAFNELYTALQTHVVDGCELPVVTIQTGRFYEVQKFLSLTNDSWSCFWWLANADAWKSIPPDLQEIIERNNAKYAALQRADTRLLNGSIADKLARQGLTIVRDVDQASFRARLSGYYSYWKGAFGATEWDLLQNAVSGKLV